MNFVNEVHPNGSVPKSAGRGAHAIDLYLLPIMINISYFYDLLESMGNRRRLSTCGFIHRAHAGAHRITAQMLILACLTGVTTLGFNISQWAHATTYLSTSVILN